MYHIGKLVFKSYMPKHLNKGMLFLTNIGKEIEVIELSTVPRDEKAFIEFNGYPVEPYIIREGNPNLNETTILATPEEIGWWDEGEHSDEYRDISTVEMNFLIEFQDGLVEILISDDNDDEIVPVKYEGKVVIRTVNDYEEDDDEDDGDDKSDFYGDEDLYDYE